MEELWSYYRVCPLANSALFVYHPIVYYNGDNVSPHSISSHSSHSSRPTGCRSSRLYPDLVPKPRYCPWLRSGCCARLVLSFRYCLGTMRPPLHGWYQTHREHRHRCEWPISFAIMTAIFTTIGFAADYDGRLSNEQTGYVNSTRCTPQAPCIFPEGFGISALSGHEPITGRRGPTPQVYEKNMTAEDDDEYCESNGRRSGRSQTLSDSHLQHHSRLSSRWFVDLGYDRDLDDVQMLRRPRTKAIIRKHF